MASDLKLANEIFRLSKEFVQDLGLSYSNSTDYPTILTAVSVILSNKALAQKLVDETWDRQENLEEFLSINCCLRDGCQHKA